MFRQNDPEELLEYAPGLRALAVRLVGASDADDLLQETWTRALRHPPATDRPAGPWLVRVLMNGARSFRRSNNRRVQTEHLAQPGEGERPVAPTPEELAAEVEVAERLMRAVRGLEGLQGTVISLRYFRGMSSREIGNALDLPASSVRWHLQRALAVLRTQLAAEGRDLPGGWVAALAPLVRLPEIAAARDVRAVAVGQEAFAGAKVAAALGALSIAGLLLHSEYGGKGPGQGSSDAASARPVGTSRLDVSLADEGATTGPRRAAAHLLEGAPRATRRNVGAPAPAATLASPSGTSRDSALSTPPSELRMALSVRVVDEAGVPIHGAALKLLDSEFLGYADSAGRCEIVLVGPPIGPGSPAESLRAASALVAEADGYRSATLELPLSTGADFDLGEVRLVRGTFESAGPSSRAEDQATTAVGQLSLLVLDPSSNPLPGAVVEARAKGELPLEFRTDAQGTLRADIDRPGDLHIRVWDVEGRYAVAELEPFVPDGARRVVTLGPVAGIQIRVETESGDPVDGFWWGLMSTRPLEAPIERWGRVAQGATARIPLAAADRSSHAPKPLVVQVDGLLPSTVNLKRSRLESDVLVVTMARPKRVRGVVRHEGQPVESALVHLTTTVGKEATPGIPSGVMGDQVGLTDSSGRFELIRPSGEPYVVCVRARDLAPFLCRSSGFGAPTALAAIELLAGGTIVGVVRPPEPDGESSGFPLLPGPLAARATSADHGTVTVPLTGIAHYLLYGLEPGSWKVELLRVDSDGRPRSTVDGSREVTVTRGRISTTVHTLRPR